ncbi:layilin isoform X2 [Polypterus senegalus]|uniref:layilin isoform X2 n=1 Tax=Polypterus senegalus TaxID=55291 RepID=UPI0019637F68|nr:layilin isoform X2 [Polypterus senegalus]
MDLVKVLALLWLHRSCLGFKQRIENSFEPREQKICRKESEKFCYKIAYFSDVHRKVNFEQASKACRSDGGELLSIESESEQRLIERFIEQIKGSDGDFWIGLRRKSEHQEATADCPKKYQWVDGSKAVFRNWHLDEPSCGHEMCVVMYYQPSASVGTEGLYMFQWNDDNCETKNNFICKYSQDKVLVSSEAGNSTHTVPTTISTRPKHPAVTINDSNNVVITESKGTALNIIYIVIPMIPLLLLLMVATGVFCFKLFAQRSKDRIVMTTKEPNLWMAPNRCNSPSLDVYNVIRQQHDADLASARPDIKNASFRASSIDAPPDNLSGDYDNMGGSHSESGFVTLASTESGFVTNEIYEGYHTRGGGGNDSGWVENEIYCY